jgi:type I restriction enzyme R subunit
MRRSSGFLRTIDKTSYGKATFKVFGKEDKQGYLDKYSIRESIDQQSLV